MSEPNVPDALPLLGPEPSNAAVLAAAKAVSLDWQNYIASMRVALIEAYRVDAPRPLLDQGKVEEVLREFGHEEDGGGWVLFADGLGDVAAPVMENARPMPTREQIAEAWFNRDPHNFGPKTWAEAPAWRRKTPYAVADFLLSLLNGAES